MSWAGWVVPGVVSFIAVPITVRGLGASQYGLLALTASLTGYLGLMELGLGSAIMRCLSYYRALGEGRPMLGVIRFALAWFSIAGVIGCLFLWLAAPWLASSVLHISADLLPTAIIVLRLTGINFFLGLVVSIGPTIPQSFLRYDISSSMGAVWGTLSSAGPAVIVTIGYGLVAVVWFTLVLSLATICVYALVGVRLFRRVDLHAGPTWREIRKKTLSFAGMSALNTVGYTVAQQTNRLVVGIAGGVEAAAYYQVPFTLASRVSDLLTAVAQVLFPTASAMFARDDLEGVRRLYLRSSRLFFLVNLSGSIGLCVLAYPLLQYWVSPIYADEGALALAMFALAQALHSASMAPSYMNLSAARPGVNLAFSTLSSAVGLAAMYPLTVRFGVSGAAAAMLISSATVPFFLYYSQKKVLGLSSRLVWRRCFLPTLIGSAIVAVVGYFIVRPLCHGLLTTLVAWVFVAAAAFAVSGAFGALSGEDLETAKRLVAPVWNRIARKVR